MYKIILMSCLFWLTTVSCTGTKESSANSDNTEKNTPFVSLCSNINYSDTAALHKEGVMSDIMTDIVKLMIRSDSTSISEGLNVFFKGLEEDPESLRGAFEYASLYLNNPDSPVRNEKLYIRFLERLLIMKKLPDDVMERGKESMRKTKLNSVGTLANDFTFVDRNGNKSTLHSIDSEQTMLVFYDPECPHCPEILERIANNPKVNAGINEGHLTVVAVYAEGKRDVWDKTKMNLPNKWMVGYDLSDILDNDLYDLPAMPTVYLLDQEKKVLVKDMRQ